LGVTLGYWQLDPLLDVDEQFRCTRRLPRIDAGLSESFRDFTDNPAYSFLDQ
jgi:hypothetical protein